MIKWARWDWNDTGPGRWHAITEEGIAVFLHEDHIDTAPAMRLACGRTRPAVEATEALPSEEVCPDCMTRVTLHGWRAAELVN